MEVTSSGRLADAGANAKPTIITVPTTPTASKGALRLGFWALGSSVCQAFAKSVAPSQRTPTKLLSHFISALRHSQRKECYFSGSQGNRQTCLPVTLLQTTTCATAQPCVRHGPVPLFHVIPCPVIVFTLLQILHLSFMPDCWTMWNCPNSAC
jgi:hypothetical protein